MRAAAMVVKQDTKTTKAKKKKNKIKTQQEDYHMRSATDKTDIMLKIYLLLVNVLYDHN